MKKSKFKVFQFLSNKIEKKTLINNFILTLFIVAFLLLIDLLSKSIFFDFSKESQNDVKVFYLFDTKIIGLRNQAHKTTTFSDLLNLDFSNLFIIIYSWIIFTIIVFLIVFTRKKFFIVGFSFILAGLLGNTIDRMFYNYVRNIFFIPWWDRGTFNFADVIVVLGSGITFIVMISKIFFLDKKKEKKNERS